MKKCDFCTQSDENGKCFWLTRVRREPHCKEAINHMVEAMGKQNNYCNKCGADMRGETDEHNKM